VIIIPQAPYLPGFYISTENFNLLLKILISLVYVLVVISVNGSFLSVGSTTFIYLIHMTLLVTKEFFVETRNPQGNHRYKTINSFRRVKTIILEYRSVDILHQSMLKIVGFNFVPLHIVISNLVLLCNYVLVTQRDKMDGLVLAVLAVWSIGTGVFWCICLEFRRYIYSHGKRVLSSWKYNDWLSARNNKLMSRFRKSCRPFRINFESVYVMRRESPLKFLKGLSRGTFRVLLALRK